jgi:tRNA A37 threonylcarbamoyladenosine dehydratase
MLGEAAMQKLKSCRVIIFGVGGVGSYTFEALIRSGIYNIDIVDGDDVSKSNINRQLIATLDTVRMPKVEAAKRRALTINPKASIGTYKLFYDESTQNEIELSHYDYIVDAIDSVKSKLLLIKKAKEAGVKIISSMGAGNKLDPTRFEVSDIYKTSVCPLARVIRQNLKKMGIDSLKVVYSKEEPLKKVATDSEITRHAPGSIAFVPSVAGLIIAGEIIREISEV